jgi:hypothetical protein
LGERAYARIHVTPPVRRYVMEQLRQAVQEAATTLGVAYVVVLLLAVGGGLAFLLSTQV